MFLQYYSQSYTIFCEAHDKSVRLVESQRRGHILLNAMHCIHYLHHLYHRRSSTPTTRPLQHTQSCLLVHKKLTTETT